MIDAIICFLFHHGAKKRVVTGYSNRTHRWHCDTCGREWDTDH